MKHKRNLRIILILCLLSLVYSCSVKKNSFKNRSYHKLTAWFNVLFNARQGIEKGIDNAKYSYKDQYDSLLLVNKYPKIPPSDQPALEFEEEAVKDSSNTDNRFLNAIEDLADDVLKTLSPSANVNISDGEGFAYAEKKALKAIKKHSMMIKGKERNSVMSLAHQILGEARYEQGKFDAAIEPFEYIIENEKHTIKNQRAKYNLAKTYWAMDDNYAAAELLEPLFKNEKLHKSLRAEVMQLYAQILMDEKRYAQAIKMLDKAIEVNKNKDLRARYYFIQGQMHQQLKNPEQASLCFDRAAQIAKDFELSFESKLAKARNFNPKQDDYEHYSNQLKKMLKENKYESRKAAIFLALGNISHKGGYDSLSQKYYQEGLLEKKASAGEKISLYTHLSEGFYKKNLYEKSMNYLDSALKSQPKPELKKMLDTRKENLKLLVSYGKIIHDNDSILHIMQLTPTAQVAFFEKHIKTQKALLAEREKQKYQSEEQLLALEENKRDFTSDPFDENRSKKWYFYNENTINQGLSLFKKKWSSIPLVDNWPWADANVTNPVQIALERDKSIDNQSDTSSKLLENPKDYIAKLPPVDKIPELTAQRNDAQLKLGIVLQEKVKNLPLAIENFETLVKQKSLSDTLKQAAYYNLYQAYTQLKKIDLAHSYKNKLLQQYPKSNYANYLLNPFSAQSIDEQTTNSQSITDYKEAYESYLKGDVKQFALFYKKAQEKYDKESIMPKFDLLNALINAKEDRLQYKKNLESIIARYPKSKEEEKAKQLLEVILQQEHKENKPALKSTP